MRNNSGRHSRHIPCEESRQLEKGPRNRGSPGQEENQCQEQRNWSHGSTATILGEMEGGDFTDRRRTHQMDQCGRHDKCTEKHRRVRKTSKGDLHRESHPYNRRGARRRLTTSPSMFNSGGPQLDRSQRAIKRTTETSSSDKGQTRTRVQKATKGSMVRNKRTTSHSRDTSHPSNGGIYVWGAPNCGLDRHWKGSHNQSDTLRHNGTENNVGRGGTRAYKRTVQTHNAGRGGGRRGYGHTDRHKVRIQQPKLHQKSWSRCICTHHHAGNLHS